MVITLGVFFWKELAIPKDYYETMPKVDPEGPPQGSGHVGRVAWSQVDSWGDVLTFRVVVESDLH